MDPLDALASTWRATWPAALATWSRVAKLSEPRWCRTAEDERREGLSSSFAMIRLVDHAVVISLAQVEALGLGDLAHEILAHEIGHHLYAPGDLTDHARSLARIRAGLPGLEREAPLVANLYTDLLINDRLRRAGDLRIDEVYRRLDRTSGSLLWSFYLHIYENLWSLDPWSLAPRPQGDLEPAFEIDARLGARVVRNYARDWLAGAGGFAALCYPYLRKDEGRARVVYVPFLDTEGVGVGGELPGGLAEFDPDEFPVHPRFDPKVGGVSDELLGEGEEEADGAKKPPRPRSPRSIRDYKDLMEAAGVKLPGEDLVVQYYRELALPHLVPFPERVRPRSTDPLPEGLDVWDAGSPVDEIDWFQSILVSPVVIPGYTTVRRIHGTTEGGDPERDPVDLYLGVDCSGSMTDPSQALSYPVLAGTILVLSALRAGARVKVVLSGEPGRHASTDDFVRDERSALRTLTGYLGTGYTFGIPRLLETFAEPKRPRPAHVLLVTDSDLYMMLDGKDGRVGDLDGWQVAREARERAGGGGTIVLHGSPAHAACRERRRLVEEGWDVHDVAALEDLVAFAAAFARKHFLPA